EERCRAGGRGILLAPSRVQVSQPEVETAGTDLQIAGDHECVVWQPEPGSVVDGFRHEQQALACRCRVGARAGRRCADRNRERSKLRFYVDELAVLEFSPPPPPPK